MANLNKHDLIFLKSKEYDGFKEKLEQDYGFQIKSTDLPDIISFTSKKIILNTSKGIFFLKEKPEYSSDKVARYRSATFQNFANKELSVVPEILRQKSGDYYIFWGGRYHFLTIYKKGRIYNGLQKDLRSATKMLQVLQRSGANYVRNYTNKDCSYLKHFESPDVTSGILALSSKIETESDKRTFARLDQIYKILCLEYNVIIKENYIMAHGDFILFNIIFGTLGVLAINDFDNAKVLPRIHDMAEFLVSSSLLNYIAPLTNLKKPIFLKPEASSFKYILGQYKQKFSLTENETTLFGVITEMIWLWSLALAVLKDDYALSDLSVVLETLEDRAVRDQVNDFLKL